MDHRKNYSRPPYSSRGPHRGPGRQPRPHPRAYDVPVEVDEHDIVEARSKSEELYSMRAHSSDVINEDNLTFEDFGLSNNLLKPIYELGFALPSPIQAKTIPVILQGMSIAARSKNGTGKTASYLIPVIQKAYDDPHYRVVVLVPTRELCYQTIKLARSLVAYMPRVTVDSSCVGVSYRGPFLKRPQVLVATPGRMIAMLDLGALKTKEVRTIVFDEADKLLGTLFRDDSALIVDYFSERKTQLVFISATFPKDVGSFFSERDLKLRTISAMRELSLEGVTQYHAYVKEEDKLKCLASLLQKLSADQIIIFCCSKKRTEILAKIISSTLKISCLYTHSKLHPRERMRIFKQFERFQAQVLVTTDLFARGIDVPNLNVVINFDFPRGTDTYLHRVGRSGRFGSKGLALAFVTEEDKEDFYRTEADLQTEITKVPEQIDQSVYRLDN